MSALGDFTTIGRLRVLRPQRADRLDDKRKTTTREKPTTRLALVVATVQATRELVRGLLLHGSSEKDDVASRLADADFLHPVKRGAHRDDDGR